MNSGKYAKYKALMKEYKLHPYLPETEMFTAKNFWRLINKYEDVILKPSAGGGGAGIIRVKRGERNEYIIYSGTEREQITGAESTLRKISEKLARKHYVVQQRVSLAKYKGRIIDVRVMVQRAKGGPWNVTGKLVKVAGAGFVITNTARSQGYVVEFEKIEDRLQTKELEQMAVLAASILSKAYKGIRTVGMDVAIDTKGHIWILECNFKPASSLFLKLKDKTMYRRIMSYYKKKKDTGNKKDRADKKDTDNKKDRAEKKDRNSKKVRNDKKAVGNEKAIAIIKASA